LLNCCLQPSKVEIIAVALTVAKIDHGTADDEIAERYGFQRVSGARIVQANIPAVYILDLLRRIFADKSGLLPRQCMGSFEIKVCIYRLAGSWAHRVLCGLPFTAPWRVSTRGQRMWDFGRNTCLVTKSD
jgi:hypothetical protein